MTVDAWLKSALADAEQRALLPEMKPHLEGLAEAMRSLRRARFIEDARGRVSGARSSPLEPRTGL